LRRLAKAAAAVALALCACRKTPEAILARQSADLQRPASEWLREESVQLLSEYVRLDTSAARGERAGVEFLKHFFDCEGIENEIVCPAPGRCNLLARLPGKTSTGALLLLNHVDVADAFPKYWKEAQPFEAKIHLGYLYGRGAYDMKSLGLAEALAMREVRRRGIVPQTDILFLGEADEEVDQKWGSRWLLEHRPAWFKGVRWVINEGGTTELLLRTPRFWGIETVQGGFASAEIEGSTNPALDRLMAGVAPVVFSPVEPHPDIVAGFGMLANHLPSPYTEPLRHLDRVREDPKQLAILPDRYASFLEARLHWSAPYEHPDSPGRVRRYVSVAVPPGVPPLPFLAPIIAAAEQQGLKVIHVSDSGPTMSSAYPSALTDLLQRVTEAHFPGVPFGPVPGFGGFTTSLIFREAGMQVYGFSPFPMNITDSARRHWNDERIYLRDYIDGVSLFSDALLEYAAVGAH
jgi:acetylornithine deacetylase/succinyl-diaminopimelate desuccinylase-like protein